MNASMDLINKNKRLSSNTDLGTQVVSFIVLLNGLVIILTTLLSQTAFRHHFIRITDLSIDLRLGVGLVLIYLSNLLRRRKRTAWLAAIIAYGFYLGINLDSIGDMIGTRSIGFQPFIRYAVLPILVILLLLINQKKFVVRSDRQGIATAIRMSVLILLTTLVYGTVGYLILGRSGFHEHLGLGRSVHYTIDQLNITTAHSLTAYTRRAKIFQDSLTFISIGAIVYIIVSFFQPIRSRIVGQTSERERFRELMWQQGNASSEDYFKLWPPDKLYFFSSDGKSALAYQVYHGSAVILGGPNGNPRSFDKLLTEFGYVCYGNDWRPSIVHCEDENRELFESHGYKMQKLGQEAVVDIDSFLAYYPKDKYFRQIQNKFNRYGYTTEFFGPPHHEALMTRLKQISDEWLSVGNRAERGFAMGYFSYEYMNNCEVMVARDAAGTIQAFINLVPAEFDHKEATYDLLRHSKEAMTNVNDFLLINFAVELKNRGYEKINLGLCPLAGLDEDDENAGLIDNVFKFAYSNGDRFYSFKGLYKFKNKYQPVWRDRYLAYQGGLRGFSKSMNALLQTMKRSTGKLYRRN